MRYLQGQFSLLDKSWQQGYSQEVKRSAIAFLILTGLFFALIAALAAIISTDFTKYFVIFHHIFFDNDLWILDPRTDLLINIVPEGFFMDTAARIGGLFAGSVLVIFALSLFFLIRNHRSKKL